MKTDTTEFLRELGAGAFEPKLAHTLSEAALATIINGQGKKKAKVNLEFTIAQVGDNDQVIVSHKIAASMPTKRGKKSEEDTTETPFFVGKGGCMTINQPKEDNSGQFALKQVD